jgi:pre-mRNA-processing factor SLU7
VWTRRDINPHIPQYMAKAPWYYGQTGYALHPFEVQFLESNLKVFVQCSPTLKHQREPERMKQKTAPIDQYYTRGVSVHTA